jgi:hypothetical protein
MSPYPAAPPPTTIPAPEPWQLRDPAGFLDDLSRLLPLSPGLIVALVRRPAEEQRLLAAVPVHWNPLQPNADDVQEELDRSACCDLLRRAAVKLWGRRRDASGPRKHAFVTVVSRPGRVVHGPYEARITRAWRYANHLLPVMSGELLLVTQHGWASDEDDSCGGEPALASSNPALASPAGDGG